MLKKKTLSLILCVTLILTAMSCFFVGGATARTFGNYKNEVTMTFEGENKYGLPITRAHSDPYGDTHETDGFATINNGAGFPSFFFAKADKLNVSEVTDSYEKADGWYTENEGKAAEFLYSFNPTKTYRISFKYNPVSAATGAYFVLCHSVNPIVEVSNVKEIDATKVSLKDVVTGDSELSRTEWKTFTYVFKPSEINSSATAVYLGIKTGGECTIQIDDIAIDLIIDSVDYNIKTVAHDMENYPEGDLTLDQTNNPELQILVDETRGHILNYTAKGQSRFGFGDQIVEKDTKYYLSFDANNVSAAEKVEPTVLIGDKSGSANYRFAIANMAYKDRSTEGCTYYIDGEKVTHDNFKYLKGWHTYGISFDTSNKDFLNAVDSYKKTFWNSTVYLTIGSNNGMVQFDDVSLTGVKNIDIASMPTEKPAVTAYSIRGEQNVAAYVSAGLRFKGSVAADKVVEGVEIGFVVAPTPSIYNVEDWYKLDETVDGREKAVYGNGEYYSYNADEGVYEYQLILSGLSTVAGATAYEVPFAAVLYVKNGDNVEYYSLGQTSYGEISAAYAVQNQTAAAE